MEGVNMYQLLATFVGATLKTPARAHCQASNLPRMDTATGNVCRLRDKFKKRSLCGACACIVLVQCDECLVGLYEGG